MKRRDSSQSATRCVPRPSVSAHRRQQVVQYRRIETTYATGKLANDHLNVSPGFEF